MGYIKIDKTNTLPKDLRNVYKDIKSVSSELSSWIVSAKAVKEDKIYKTETVSDSRYNALTGVYETYWREKVVYDYRKEFEKYKQCLDDADRYNVNNARDMSQEVDRLAKAVEGLVSLIEEFDDVKNFKLSDAYAENSNITIVEDGDTVTLCFKDEDGNMIEMSDLLNCFYTYTGMSMSGVVQGYLYAQENGIEFSAEYQQQILDGVNATISTINERDGFSFVTTDELEKLSAMLGFDYNAIVDNSKNVGADWSNMEIGSNILNQNYVMQKSFNFDPNASVGGAGSGGTTGDLGNGSNSGGRPITIDSTTTPVSSQTTPSSLSSGASTSSVSRGDYVSTNVSSSKGSSSMGTSDGSVSSSVDLIDYGGADDFKEMLPDIENDYDDVAKQMFENLSDSELTAFREQSINNVQNLIDNNDISGLAQGLSNYGYSDSEISNFIDTGKQVIKNASGLVAAFVAGDQKNYISNLASELAEKTGIKDFFSPGGKNSEADSGSSSSSIGSGVGGTTGEDENDEIVKRYQKAKTYYKQKSEEVNEAAEDAKEALEEVNGKLEKYGSDTSKWTDEQKKDYNEAKENFEEARDRYEEKVSEYNEAEKEYQDAKEDYNDANRDFEEEIRENVKENENFDDDGSEDDASDLGNDAETNSEIVETEVHEGEVNADGTVSISDQGLLDAIDGFSGEEIEVAGNVDDSMLTSSDGNFLEVELPEVSEQAGSNALTSVQNNEILSESERQAAIAAQISQEEAEMIKKQTESDSDVIVNSNGKESVVTIKDDTLLNAIKVEN